MRRVFSYKKRQFCYKIRRLLQNVSVHNAMYSSDKNANIVINRLRHDVFDNIRKVL